MLSIFYLFFSSLLGFLLLPKLVDFLRLYLLDSPSQRSSHILPTPRGGGIIFILSPLFSCLFLFPFFGTRVFSDIPSYIFLLPIFFVGLVDDKYNLSPLIKFFPQLLTCIYLLCNQSMSPASLILPSYTVYGSVIFICAVFAMVLFVNLVNFTDGLDGLVSSSFLLPLFTSLYLTSSTPLDWFFLGSLISFLFFNWSPAKIFMGDCGSLFIGSYYLFIAMRASSLIEFLILISLVSPLILDSLVCLARRLISKKNIFKAHRQHLFQRLHSAGWSHSLISLIYASFCLLMSISALFHSHFLITILIILQLFVGYWLETRYATPFNFSGIS